VFGAAAVTTVDDALLHELAIDYLVDLVVLAAPDARATVAMVRATIAQFHGEAAGLAIPARMAGTVASRAAAT
jgi:hypothetical protein